MFLVGICTAIGIGFASCNKSSDSGGSGNSNDTVTGTAGSYHGAGSKWTADFTTSDFTIKKYNNIASSTESLTVQGTYVQYTSGFRKLTVTSASGTDAPSTGAEAYGFDVPGFAFFLKPIGADAEPIVMIQSGSCPSSSFNGNWIIAKFDDGKTLTDSDDSFGSANFTFSGASSTATINKLTPVTGSQLASSTVSFNYNTCSSATLTFSPSAGETVDMFFTANGGALVHSFNTSATHDSIIFAAPKTSAAVTQADMAGTYSVLVFDDRSTSDKLFPAKIELASSGNSTAYKISDVATDTTSSDSITISSIASHTHSNGLFTAAINAGSDDGRISCAYFTATSGTTTSKVLACNGYGKNSDKKPFFFLGKAR